uniref:Acyl carrier protein n=1 Tax=Rhabditophanes sp. KR3021 TaxID=114890 RepID=A0AC35U2C3_9BILA
MLGRVVIRAFAPFASATLKSTTQAMTLKTLSVSPQIKAQTATIFTTPVYCSAKAPLTKHQVEARIKLVLGCFDKVKSQDISMDADLFKDLGLDSLDHVELMCTIEEEFGFEIPDGLSDQFKTPRDIAQFIFDKEDVFE